MLRWADRMVPARWWHLALAAFVALAIPAYATACKPTHKWIDCYTAYGEQWPEHAWACAPYDWPDRVRLRLHR